MRCCLAVFAVLFGVIHSVAGSFPLTGIMPKEEIGALRFLGAHPDYDGRGVKVAIFDTGVDPGAEGLQTTSDGKPKIVDVIDASGSGDVDTSTVAKIKDGKVKGLTGRTLKLDPEWKPKNGEVHLGIKAAYELYPAALVSRVKAKRREAWDRGQRALMLRERKALEEFDRRHPKPDAARLKARGELEERIRQLKALQSGYRDPGPVYDCLVFNDGKVWRAVVDTDEDGDLTDEKAMTNFRAEREYATFGKVDLLNFAVNIYDRGRRLSIVADCGAHGTHVAGIVAGHYPDQPELNGVAPGAQIVSVKIGDTRLGSSSTGMGESRGMVAVLANQCDLVNMSYGGDNLLPNRDRSARLFSELVNRHGVIFVSSAGNNGPALSTVGSPGGTTSAILGVGAYVSSSMMKAQYSLREQMPGLNFTWSSRGPTFDGDIGVDICAPGAAIAPVSNWTLQRNMLMNGTSMSSPNACGAIALLLSACKAEKLAHTPHRIRRALVNTAERIETVTPFAQGAGLLQVDRAWEYLTQHRGFTDQDLRFEVSVSDGHSKRGIYLREPFHFTRPREFSVKVSPRFHRDADNRGKVDFQMRLNLACDASWISIPESLIMMHGGRSMKVRVDATELSPGAHYAEVVGIDAGSPDRGPVFRIPVTVIKPEPLAADGVWRGKLKLGPGKLERRFFALPAGAEWAELRMNTAGQEDGHRLVVHTGQRLPASMYSRNSSRNYFTFDGDDERVHSFAVRGGYTLELCLAQYWSSLGETEVDFEFVVRGLRPVDRHVFIDGAEPATRVEVTSPLRKEELSPSGSLDTWVRTLRPVEAKIRTLPDRRDLLPDTRLMREAVLTYRFSLDGKAKVKFGYGVNDEWESGIWILYDENKRRVATGSRKEQSLAKGGYTLKLHLRQDDRKLLERVKDLPLRLSQKFSRSIGLSFHPTWHDARLGGTKFLSGPIRQGELAAFYVGGLKSSQMPKGSQPGDVLTGKITFGKADSSLAGTGRHPRGFDVVYRVPPSPTPAKKATAATPKRGKPKSEKQRRAEAIRDLKVGRLAGLYSDKNTKAFEELVAEIAKDWPDHRPVLVHQLKRLDSGPSRTNRLNEIVAAADQLIGKIDGDALRRHYGERLDEADSGAKATRRRMDTEKALLVDALIRKTRALADHEQSIAGSVKKEIAAARKAFSQAWRELGKWADATNAGFAELQIRYESSRHRFGTALKLHGSRMAKKSRADRKLIEGKIKLLESLRWNAWADHERRWNLLRFPRAYQPF